MSIPRRSRTSGSRSRARRRAAGAEQREDRTRASRLVGDDDHRRAEQGGDCIHLPTEDRGRLAEQPEECIDCDACVEACPVDAITPEDMVPAEWHDYIERNAAYYQKERR